MHTSSNLDFPSASSLVIVPIIIDIDALIHASTRSIFPTMSFFDEIDFPFVGKQFSSPKASSVTQVSLPPPLILHTARSRPTTSFITCYYHFIYSSSCLLPLPQMTLYFNLVVTLHLAATRLFHHHIFFAFPPSPSLNTYPPLPLSHVHPQQPRSLLSHPIHLFTFTQWS